jgi:WD40 repeat protein
LRGDGARVDAVAFDRDGGRLASADADGRLVVWDVADRKPVVTLRAPGQHLSSVAFGPNGVVAVGAESGLVRVADVDKRRWVDSVGADSSRINGLAFAPSGSVALTASDDGDARIWDVATWTPVADLRPTGSKLTGAGFAPSGRRLVVAGGHAAFVYGCETCLDGSQLKDVAAARIAAAR